MVVNLGYNSPGQNVSNSSGEIFTTPQQTGMQVLQQMTGGPTVVVSFLIFTSICTSNLNVMSVLTYISQFHI